MSDKSNEKLGGCIMVLFATFILTPISVIVNSVCFETIWNWLVPVIFTSMSKINFWQAWAICLIASFLTYSFKPDTKKNNDGFSYTMFMASCQSFLYVIARGIIAVGIAYLIKSCW